MVVRAEGPARAPCFCAGGDVKELAGLAAWGQDPQSFVYNEYRMDAQIFHFPKVSSRARRPAAPPRRRGGLTLADQSRTFRSSTAS